MISGDSEDAAGCSDGIEAPDLSNVNQSFKLVKRDLYLERQQQDPKLNDNFTELQAIMGLKVDEDLGLDSHDRILASVIKKIQDMKSNNMSSPSKAI